LWYVLFKSQPQAGSAILIIHGEAVNGRTIDLLAEQWCDPIPNLSSIDTRSNLLERKVSLDYIRELCVIDSCNSIPKVLTSRIQ
jgi:hypothetical protein